jgi:hypothetical protein
MFVLLTRCRLKACRGNGPRDAKPGLSRHYQLAAGRRGDLREGARKKEAEHREGIRLESQERYSGLIVDSADCAVLVETAARVCELRRTRRGVVHGCPFYP